MIDTLRKYCNVAAGRKYALGIGDDAAVRLCHGERMVLTGDILVEGVHFSLEYMTLPEVGYKALAVNLSDCAAMGARPDSVLVQVVLPEGRARDRELRSLYRGVRKVCERFDISVVGGDLSKGPCWVLAVTALGVALPRHRLLRRDGARVGDGLWVTGRPGESAAGLAALRKWGSRKRMPARFRPLARRHIAPTPRVVEGVRLSRDVHVHAMIDISDGVSKECRTLCARSRVGIALDITSCLVSRAIRGLADLIEASWTDWFLYGGEDYELLFAASEEFDPAGYPGMSLFRLGTVTARQGVVEARDWNGTRIKVEAKAWDIFA